MKNLVQSYDPMQIENSPIEFVLIGTEFGDFRPIAMSSNCGLDLLGYAASRSYAPNFVLNEHVTSSVLSVWRRAEDNFTHQFIELDVVRREYDEIDDYESSTVFFYWKGPRLKRSALEEISGIAKINLGVIMNEVQVISNRTDVDVYRSKGFELERKHNAFLSWHLSPVIQAIDYFNQHERRRKDLTRLFISTYVLVVGAVATVAALRFAF